mmetsp:Transcript_10784/g.23468  ORF Transcript_10784/g.23468 Transcript_10784/m.23468 type:complete len:313 (-) Transcript_10784:1393-2331(-)
MLGAGTGGLGGAQHEHLHGLVSIGPRGQQGRAGRAGALGLELPDGPGGPGAANAGNLLRDRCVASLILPHQLHPLLVRPVPSLVSAEWQAHPLNRQIERSILLHHRRHRRKSGQPGGNQPRGPPGPVLLPLRPPVPIPVLKSGPLQVAVLDPVVGQVLVGPAPLGHVVRAQPLAVARGGDHIGSGQPGVGPEVAGSGAASDPREGEQQLPKDLGVLKPTSGHQLDLHDIPHIRDRPRLHHRSGARGRHRRVLPALRRLAGGRLVIPAPHLLDRAHLHHQVPGAVPLLLGQLDAVHPGGPVDIKLHVGRTVPG